MQMGKRLAQRKGHLMPVEGPPEQDRQQLHGALGAFAGSDNLLAARPVMGGKSVDPLV